MKGALKAPRGYPKPSKRWHLVPPGAQKVPKRRPKGAQGGPGNPPKSNHDRDLIWVNNLVPKGCRKGSQKAPKKAHEAKMDAKILHRRPSTR